MLRQRLWLAFTFIVDIFAIYGLVLLVTKYFPNLPGGITFDMIAISLLVLRFLKIIFFDKQ